MSTDANFVDTDRSCCFQDLCMDSNSGQGSIFEDYGGGICNSEGYLYPGAWACLRSIGEENLLDESIPSCAGISSVGVSSCDEPYDTLIQQLAFMIPQSFLKTPIDEFAVVKGALDYVVHLKQMLEQLDTPERDTFVVRPKTVFVPRSCSEHMRHVHPDSSVDDAQLPGENNALPLVPCPVLDGHSVSDVSPACLFYPSPLWQDKVLNSHCILTTPNNDKEITPRKSRKNSYTVFSDRTFSDIVPSSETRECAAEGTHRDLPWLADSGGQAPRNQFTRIKDPGLWHCLSAEIYNSYGMSSVEKYPVLSSLLDETEWDFPGKDDDDEVFLTSSQPEPDSTTAEKGHSRGLRRPKNGFIRFSVEYRKLLAKQHPKLDNREVSKMLGAKWRRMSHEEKIPYEMEFRKDISELRSKHPEWRYAPLKQMETEHIEPMPSRLRPRDKLKKKFLPTIIKYGPDISERRQPRGSRKKRGKMAPFSTFSSFAWFQCKLCYKWRYVPCIDDDNLPIYQSMWFCHMNPDPTCNSCFAADGLSGSHSVMTSSVATSFQAIPCSTVSVFTTVPNTTIQ